MASYSTVAVCAFGVFFFYFYYGILQEKLFRSEYGTVDKQRFQFITTALLLQCMSSCVAAFVALQFQKLPSNDVYRGGQFPLLSAVYLGAMLCSNWALKYVNYPTQVIGKSCKPIPIMLFGVFFANKRYSLQKYLFVALIVAGVAIFTYKDSKAKSGGDSSSGFAFGMGEALLLLSLAQDGCVAAIQDRMKAFRRPSAYQMMFAMNLWSSFFGLLVVIYLDELLPFLDFISRYPDVTSNLFMFCACSVLGQIFIFKSVTELSPLSCSIITTTRKCFTVLASVLMFGNSLTGKQWAGVTLVFTGLFMDNFFGAKK
ncbi:solute carrier family 35 member B1-like [Convolutriloba macropyga]|uniref:solute carrier family 35 member B1-like n=1 Tax=Convolutriloba macropyga TaxID=536237 RepID=UPI003F51DEA3